MIRRGMFEPQNVNRILSVVRRSVYTAKSYVLNQKWNQSDPDLYPETQQNFLATGLIPNCKSDLYQFCSSVSVQQKQP